MPLEPRELGDLLAEELRRLDADEIYAAALAVGHRRAGPAAAARDAHPRLARPDRGERPRPGAHGLVSRPDPTRGGRHRDAEVLAAAVAARLLTRLRRRAGAARHGLGRADRRRRRHRGAGGRRPLARPARPSTGAGRRLVGRRALRARRRPRAQRAAGPRGAARPLPVDPERVHPMGARGGPDGDDADAAAARYADELGAAAPPDERRAAVRRPAARHGPRGPHGLDLPGVAGRARRAARWSACTAAPSRRRPGSRWASPRSTPPARCGWSSPASEKAPMVAMALAAPGRVQVPAAGVQRPRARRCGCSTRGRRRSSRATCAAADGQVGSRRAGSYLSAELGERLGEDRLAVLGVAALADVGQVGLVRLVLDRRRAGCPCPGRRGSRSAGSPRSRGSRPRRRTTAGSRAALAQ